MKKILIPVLVLMLICVGLATAAGEEAITLDVKTEKLPVYAADDPYLEGFGLVKPEDETEAEAEDALPVLLLPVKKSLQLQTTVMPKTVKNRKVELSVADEETVRVKGNSITGLKAGETVLTIASIQDPAVTVQFRVAVIQLVNRISLTAPAKSVAVGQAMTLTSSILPEDASMKDIVWLSADERIATVDGNGTVTGVKRGSTRITATAQDGSKIRANINVQVTQNAEEITLDKPEVTVDVGRTATVKAAVLPKDTNDKGVIWTSSDESIAKVNGQGRITGVALGECEIICASKTNGEIQARAAVHVQQPVKKVTFDAAPVVYVGENGKLTWAIEPANASNQALKLTSTNQRVLTVSDDGTITGLQVGESYVRAVTTDGSNRQAKVRVRVMQHVTGVHMKRKTAYIDPKQSSTCSAILEPEKGTNHNMTWVSADPSVATVTPERNAPNKVKITGVGYGQTTVTGTTEDGGYQTSIQVRVDDWEKSLRWIEGDFDARGRLDFKVKNVSDLDINSVTIEVEFYDFDGTPLKGMNTKDGSNKVKGVYSKMLNPGATTKEDGWKMIDYNREYANDHGFAAIISRITEFQIDYDWVKLIRGYRQPEITYNPHRVLK